MPTTSARRNATLRPRCITSRARARALPQSQQKPIRVSRASKRRKLRDQESLDLGDCFYQCLDQGYHLDPDVHVGSAVTANINPFSVLDSDITDPTEVHSDPPYEFTFSHARPAATATLSHPLQHSQTSPKRSELLVVRSKRRPRSSSDVVAPPTDLSELNDTPRAKPYSSVSDLESHAKPNDKSTGYLDEIRIPSPLLYHRSYVTATSCQDDEKTDSDLPQFELAYGQPKPEPDFTTYRGPSTKQIQTGAPRSLQEDTFVAAKLPSMGSTSDRRTNSETGSLRLSTIDAKTPPTNPADQIENLNYSSICQAATEYDRIDMPGAYIWDVIQDEDSQSRNADATRNFYTTDDNLVFPTLPITDSLRTVNTASWNSTIVPLESNNAGKYAQPEDNQPCLMRHHHRTLTVSRPTPTSFPFSSRPSLACWNLDSDQALDRECPFVEERRGDSSSFAAPHSRDLILASTYPMDMLNWSDKLWFPKNTPQTTRFESSSLCANTNEVEEVIALLEWLKNLLISDDKEQAKEVNIADPSTRQRTLWTRPFSKSVDEPDSSLSQTKPVQPPEDTGSGDEDEGYHTANEENTDEELLDASWSQEEFPDWDWDWEWESGVDDNEEDMLIGLLE